METHKLLNRQLTRLALNSETPPAPAKWQEFLERVNNAYKEADQDRYLIERSMEISSRELSALNQKLENAQKIAQLGYWDYDKTHEKIICSRSMFDMLGLNPSDATPNFEMFMAMVHEREREDLRVLIEQAFSKGSDYETEIRMKNVGGEYHWYRVIAHPIIDEESALHLSGVLININKRKLAEEEVNKLHHQLMDSARGAGMADVATAILHNVGNILNSANTSIAMLRETFIQPHYEKFFAAINMFKEHLPTLAEYLTQDPKGKIIPAYLTASAEIIHNEHTQSLEEINTLITHLQHIKDIVAMQQTLSGISGFTEKVFLPEVFDNALQMNAGTQNNIKINKNYEKKSFIVTDKNKLLQILVNLIQNAKDAVMENTKVDQKEINLMIKSGLSENEIIISISDNGIGIAPENITKIFSFGFTTKKNGHGFGLHTSALAAMEMGGKLSAKSDGHWLGANFILTLPTQTTLRTKNTNGHSS